MCAIIGNTWFLATLSWRGRFSPAYLLLANLTIAGKITHFPPNIDWMIYYVPKWTVQWGLVNNFLRVPLACLGSREQGSRAGMPVELSENSLQNLLYSSFWDVVVIIAWAAHKMFRPYTSLTASQTASPSADTILTGTTFHYFWHIC